MVQVHDFPVSNTLLARRLARPPSQGGQKPAATDTSVIRDP